MTGIIRPGLEQIDQSGAADGNVPLWSNSAGVWVPGIPGINSITTGSYLSINTADPHNVVINALLPLTTLNTSGLPEIVFDSDGHIVYAEAP